MKKVNDEETEKKQEEPAEPMEEQEAKKVPDKEKETPKEATEAKKEEAIEESLEKELKEEEAAEETVEAEKEELLPAEEEAKPKREEKAEEEEEIVEDRTYTVPLSKAWIMPPNKRAAKAMRILKKFIVKHMKLEARKEGEEEEEKEPATLVITNEVNERVWSRGIEKPPRKIRVRAAKDKDGDVTVYLAEGD